jgi:hypothetical protein
MIREFLKSTNCMVLIIAVAVCFVLSSLFTACSKSDKELELIYKERQAKIIERKDLIEKGFTLVYIKCIESNSMVSNLEKCKSMNSQ